MEGLEVHYCMGEVQKRVKSFVHYSCYLPGQQVGSVDFPAGGVGGHHGVE